MTSDKFGQFKKTSPFVRHVCPRPYALLSQNALPPPPLCVTSLWMTSKVINIKCCRFSSFILGLTPKIWLFLLVSIYLNRLPCFDPGMAVIWYQWSHFGKTISQQNLPQSIWRDKKRAHTGWDFRPTMSCRPTHCQLMMVTRYYYPI